MENKRLYDIIQDYLANGKKTEDFVGQLIEELCGGTCEKSTTNEDKLKHIDIL